MTATRGDSVLLWLLIITLFLGGVGTLLVIFLVDVLL
jgi:hypothetical protein